MSTSAFLNFEKEGTIYVNRVNWDGYPSNMLEQLNRFHKDPVKAFDLVNGDEIDNINNSLVERYSEYNDHYPLKVSALKTSEEYNYKFDHKESKWVLIK